RVKTLIIATTLLDAEAFTQEDLAQLYRALERGAGSQVAETDAANGYPALQDPGVGPEGAVDAHPGLQPDPHAHGPSCDQARNRAPRAQLQGGGANAGSLSASAGGAGRPRGGTGDRLWAPARRHRHPPGCRSAGPL